MQCMRSVCNTIRQLHNIYKNAVCIQDIDIGKNCIGKESCVKFLWKLQLLIQLAVTATVVTSIAVSLQYGNSCTVTCRQNLRFFLVPAVATVALFRRGRILELLNSAPGQGYSHCCKCLPGTVPAACVCQVQSLQHMFARYSHCSMCLPGSVTAAGVYQGYSHSSKCLPRVQ